MTNEIRRVGYMTGMYDSDDEYGYLHDTFYDPAYDMWLDEREWLEELGYTFDPETDVATNYTTEDFNAAQPC